jgi:hypothetical protein
MKKKPFKHIEVFQIVICLVIVAIAGLDMVGQPARLPMVLALAASSIGAGAGMGVYFERRRRRPGE